MRNSTIMTSLTMLLACASMLLRLSSVSATTGESCSCAALDGNTQRYQFDLGGYKATIINDGTTFTPIEQAPYPEAPASQLQALLSAAYLPTDQVRFDRNVLLLETGSEKILVDAGAGTQPLFGTPDGALLKQLACLGVAPADISRVVLTHGHFDHIGALVLDASDPTTRTFKNAKVHVSEEEVAYWTAPEPMGQPLVPPELFAQNVQLTRAVLALYKDQLVTFKLGSEVLPGIDTWPATWHTPGHAMIILPAPADDGAAGPFVFGGDAAGHVQLSIENPTFAHTFDTFTARGPRGRVKLLKALARRRARFLSAHAVFPGLGGVAVANNQKKTFKWEPVPW